MKQAPMLRKSYWGHPEGFAISSGGKVVYVNGEQYRTDGNNPCRVESIFLYGDGLANSYEGDDIQPATREQAEVFVKRIRDTMEKNKTRALRVYQAEIASFERIASKFERLLNEDRAKDKRP